MQNGKYLKNIVLKSIVQLIKHASFIFIRHIQIELFGNWRRIAFFNNWRRIYEQTSSTFYIMYILTIKIMRLQNNALRKKIRRSWKQGHFLIKKWGGSHICECIRNKFYQFLVLKNLFMKLRKIKVLTILSIQS